MRLPGRYLHAGEDFKISDHFGIGEAVLVEPSTKIVVLGLSI